MRKTILIAFLILACKGSSFASHIVGGEFELVYLQGDNYRLNLIIYFDEIYGHPGAKYSPTPIAWIYRKSDNSAMRQVTLPLFSEELVKYTIPACTDNNKVKTTKLIFSTVISMNPEEYDDAEGYYIVWQRCCRNYEIVNIVSEDPDQGGTGAGQTFYLEIPPLMKNGERFINTSPQLFPPLSDYACVNRSYYADFKGSDVDGDSLVYTLVEPLNTPSATPHPQPPSTAPYPITQWASSFSLNNIVQGDPDLTITNDGLLRVTPTQTGIFVFAVKVEEFRGSEKIGEVRRDFQMVVVDCPPPGNQPDVSIELEDGSTYQEGDVLRFLADDSKCVKFTVEDEKGGKVNLKLDPLTFDEENFTYTILSRSLSGDKLTAEVCFTGCPPNRDLPFEVNFIGLDNTCPQPLQDTVKLTVSITPPENKLPVIKHKTDNDVGYSLANQRTVTVIEKAGGRKIVELLGEDGNNDHMDFVFSPIGFDLEDYGMSIIEKANTAGRLETWLEWNYDCRQISFDDQTEFQILITLDDQDICLYKDPVFFTLDLKIILPDNSLPRVFSNKLGYKQDNYFRIESHLGETISFDVSGEDLDGDFAIIEAFPANFNFDDYGISYSGVSGEGKSTPPQVATQLTSNFTWLLTCSRFNLAEQDSFRVYFTIEDFDKCQITNRDTLTVDFVLSEPFNIEPQMEIVTLNDLLLKNDSIHVVIGEEVQLQITGIELEGDSVFLSLLNSQAAQMSYIFANGKGKGEVSSDFLWSPECFVLNGQTERFIPLTFQVKDSHCVRPVSLEKTIMVHVLDKSSRSEQFVPPNIFTPNGDKYNPYFGMYRINPNTLQEENILPIDNCAGQFVEVVIYNRWGQVVYQSNDRDFKWDGHGVSSGVYFYGIKYSNTVFRGTLSVVF